MRITPVVILNAAVVYDGEEKLNGVTELSYSQLYQRCLNFTAMTNMLDPLKYNCTE